MATWPRIELHSTERQLAGAGLEESREVGQAGKRQGQEWPKLRQTVMEKLAASFCNRRDSALTEAG